MPRPVDRHTVYSPGLDGIRAVAVTLVIVFHLGVPGFQGGLLGVGLFFTLSGYLITGVLMTGWQRHGSWDLKTFWVRRARRLLPAVVVVLSTSMVVVAITDRTGLRRYAVQAVAALFYVANWHTIATGGSYFTQIHGPGPFAHLWSLAVEEQFYLIWPLLLGLLVALTRARWKLVAPITALLAAGSFLALGLLAYTGVDNTRAYEGTDTRAGGLLVGACLAIALMHPDGSLRQQRGYHLALQVAGLGGLVGIGWLVTHTNENTIATYRWGLLLLSVCAAAVLAAVVRPGTLLGTIFGIAPLRWVGERSYGLYLWHLPVIVFTPDDALTTHPLMRGLVQVAIMLGLAAASWRLVEDPIRTHGLLSALRGARAGVARHPHTPPCTPRSPGLVLGAAVFLPVAVLAMLLPAALPRESHAQVAVPPATPAPPTTPSGPSSTPGAPASPTPSGALRTACTSVFLVGDSTSEGLYGKASVLAPAQNLKGQLQKVGVRSLTADIAGARSIIESYKGQTSGKQVVTKYITAGYHGCWIISLGNVDAATVAKYAPDTTSIPDRITTIMDTIGKDQPVMWLSTRTIRQSGDFPPKRLPAMEPGPNHSMRQVPGHARVRLGQREQDRLDRPRPHPLHPDRLPAQSPTHGTRHSHRLPRHRAPAKKMPAQHPVTPLPASGRQHASALTGRPRPSR